MSRAEPLETVPEPAACPSTPAAGGAGPAPVPEEPVSGEPQPARIEQGSPAAASLWAGAISKGTVEPGQTGLDFVSPQAFASTFPSVDPQVRPGIAPAELAGAGDTAAAARRAFAWRQPVFVPPLVVDVVPVRAAFAAVYPAFPRLTRRFSQSFPLLDVRAVGPGPSGPVARCGFGFVQPRWEPPAPMGADVIPFPGRGRAVPDDRVAVLSLVAFGLVQPALVPPPLCAFSYAAGPLPAVELRAFACVQPARRFRPLASGFPFAVHFDSYTLLKPVRVPASDLLKRVALAAARAEAPAAPAVSPPATDLRVGGSRWSEARDALGSDIPDPVSSDVSAPGAERQHVGFEHDWGPWTPAVSGSVRMRPFACSWALLPSFQAARRSLRLPFAVVFASRPRSADATAACAVRVPFQRAWASWPFPVRAAPVFRAFACSWAALRPARLAVSTPVGFDAVFAPWPPALVAFAWADVPLRLPSAGAQQPVPDPASRPSTQLPEEFVDAMALDSTVTPAGGRSATEEKPVPDTPSRSDAPAGETRPNGKPAGGEGKPPQPTLASTSESGVSLVEDSLQHGIGARGREQGFDAATEKMMLDELKASGVDVSAYVEQLQKQLEVRRRSITAFELQLTVHQAVDSWRSSTREAAVRIHKMIDDTQQSGELLLKHAVYLEGVVALVTKRVQTFEGEIHAQLGRLGTEVDTSVDSAAGKLGGVQAKIEGLAKALSARLDAHVEAATTRSKTLFDQCDAASNKLSESLNESVRKIEGVQGALRTAQESVHNVETRAANVSRDLVQMDRSMSETLNAFRMPIVLPALVGGLVGAGVGAFIAVLIWRLLAGG